MKLVGLTGGIGSGKTTALNCFRGMGVPCFVSDVEAKKLYDNVIFAEKVKLMFCDLDITDTNGKIDKKKLANIVFNDNYHLEKLNSLVHPELRKTFFDWAADITVKHPDVPYVIIESALIFQTELDKLLDDVIYVYQYFPEFLKNGRSKQSLDFYLPKYNIAIECQGKQHYTPVKVFGGKESFIKQVKMDKIKYDKCLKNGITILYFSQCKEKDKNAISSLKVLLNEITKNIK